MARNGQPLQLVFALFVVLQVCEGERYCKTENCGEEANKHEEYSISQTVIEESLFMISPEDFYYNFLVKHRPFVMRRVARNWPAYTVWTETYLIQSLTEDLQVSVIKGLQNFPFGGESNMPVKEFFSRYSQEDLTLCDEPTMEMLNDIRAPLCAQCHQFMEKMTVKFWFHHRHKKASTSLFFQPDEQLLTVLNGSATVILISPLHSEKLPFDGDELLAISSFDTDTLSSRGIPYLTVDLVKGDMFYVPQMWWQHVTFSIEYNLFVQFLWPSKTAITSGNLQSSTQIRGDHLPSIPASLRNLLRKYEEKFLMTDVRPLVCLDQDKRMSEYTFETGKMSPDEYEAIHNGPDFTEEEPCNFDASNLQSPCHFATCFEDPESPICIRYILDYCSHWEDRGCAIELPQLLNKVEKSLMKQIASLKSSYQ